MIEADITDLMKKYQVDGYTLNGAGHAGVERLKDGRLKLTFGGMPNLNFFVDLAALAGVPIGSIETEVEEGGSGCDTCGYGGGTEYFAYVPQASDGGVKDA